MTPEEITFNEAPLEGMLTKTLSEYSEAELRAFVADVQNVRTTTQTLRARIAIAKAIKSDEREQKQVNTAFAEF